MADYILRDQMFLLPLSALVLVVLIGVMLKSFTSALIPVINAAISAIWTIGVMVLLDIPINMLNYIVPALILVIGATEDVHLLVEYRENKAKNAPHCVRLRAGSGSVLQLCQYALCVRARIFRDRNGVPCCHPHSEFRR